MCIWCLSHLNYVKSNHELYHENEEQLLIRPCEKAWSVFAEAYQADARDFKVSVPHYSLHAFLDWRLNFEDPALICSASLLPAPVCNHEDCIPEFVPVDNLLDHPPALAVVDGAPGFQSALAPLSAVPSVSAHIGGLASACNYSVPHAVVPDD